MAERRAPAAMGLLIALLAVAIAVTPASGQLTLRKGRSAELAPKADGSARASCPRRGSRHLISGGFASDSPFKGERTSTVAAFASKPSGGRAWRLRAANFDGAATRVTASVLCSRRSPRARVRTKSVRVAAAGRAKATVRCHGREEAIAGGFSAPASAQDAAAEVIAVESRRKGQHKWRVIAYNNSADVDGRLKAYVRCAARKPHLRTAKSKGVAVDQAPVEVGASCEKGEELWSGGFVASFQSFDPFAVIVADRSYADGRRWVSRFVGYQTGGPVKSIAYCRPKG